MFFTSTLTAGGDLRGSGSKGRVLCFLRVLGATLAVGRKRPTFCEVALYILRLGNYGVRTLVAPEPLGSFMKCRCADTLSLGLYSQGISNPLGPAYMINHSVVRDRGGQAGRLSHRFLCCPLEGNPSAFRFHAHNHDSRTHNHDFTYTTKYRNKLLCH